MKIAFKPRQWAGIGVVLVLVGAVSWWAGQRVADVSSKQIKVVASFYPFYEFARQVAGDKADVTSVTPSGTEPHDYEPTPQELVAVRNADVFVYDGATLEPWAAKVVGEVKGTVVKASDGVTLREGLSEEGKPEPGTTDPHFWLDPQVASGVVDSITAALVKQAPGDKAYFEARAQAYKEQLAALDAAYVRGLATCQKRTVITSHAAFGYLSARYNFTALPIAGLSPEEEPNPAKIAELATLAKQQGIGYVFFESLVSPKLAQTVADEAGAKTLVFDPIEGVSDADQKAGRDYLSISRDNLANLRLALACQ